MKTSRLNLDHGNMVILYLPANFFHSNVGDTARQEYMIGLPSLIDSLANAGFPIAVSFQGIDLALVGADESDVRTGQIELLAAPWAHFLPSLVGDDEMLGRNAHWQVELGVAVQAAGRFNPEFDTPPQRHLLPHAGQIIPCVAPSTVMYSDLDVTDADPEHVLMKREAVAFNGNILVPLSGPEKVNGAWFEYQRFPTDENLGKVIAELRTLLTTGSGRVFVWYVDLEGPIVGSHFGFQLWSRLFEAIRNAGLAERFTTFEASRGHFQGKAQTLGYKSIARDLGGKWTKWPTQVSYVMGWGKLPNPQTDFDQAVLSLITVSDALSAMGSKWSGPIIKPAVTPEGEKKDVIIGFDQTVLSISLRMLEEYRDQSKGYRTRVLDALRNLRSTDERYPTTEAGQFFASRVADMLENFAI